MPCHPTAEGWLADVEAGTCDIVGTLTITDKQMVLPRMRLELPATMKLRSRIPLLADGEEATAVSAA